MLDFYYCEYGNYRNRDIKPIDSNAALGLNQNVIVSNHYKNRYIAVLDIDGDYNVRATVNKLKELDIEFAMFYSNSISFNAWIILPFSFSDYDSCLKLMEKFPLRDKRHSGMSKNQGKLYLRGFMKNEKQKTIPVIKWNNLSEKTDAYQFVQELNSYFDKKYKRLTSFSNVLEL